MHAQREFVHRGLQGMLTCTERTTFQQQTQNQQVQQATLDTATELVQKE